MSKQQTIDYIKWNGRTIDFFDGDQEDYDAYERFVDDMFNMLNTESYANALRYAEDEYNVISKDIRSFVEFLSL